MSPPQNKHVDKEFWIFSRYVSLYQVNNPVQQMAASTSFL